MFETKERQAVDTIEAYSKHLQSLNLSQNTIDSRTSVAYRLHEYLLRSRQASLHSKDLHNIRGYMLDAWYQTLDVSPQSRNLYVVNIQSLFEYLVKAGYMETDPSEILKKVRIIKDDSEDGEESNAVYSIEDVIALIDVELGPSVDARDRAMVSMLLGGGFRASELCSLNVGDFRNMKNGRIYTLRKGGAKKWVYVADYAIEYVKDYLETRPDAADDEPLFVTRTGGRFTRVTLWQRMKKRQDALNLKTGVHITRGTFITEVNRHNSIGITQRLGSHKSDKTTQIYIRPTQDELRNAANSVSWAHLLQQEPNE